MPTYRLVCRYRTWIGKPDPSGFGRFTVASSDPSWLHEEAVRLKRKGHAVYATERQETPDAPWRRI